jgi:hypothetical protein
LNSSSSQVAAVVAVRVLHTLSVVAVVLVATGLLLAPNFLAVEQVPSRGSL